MGDHGVDVNFGQSGRHRAESRREVRSRGSDLLDPLDPRDLRHLLDLLEDLRSVLAADRADGVDGVDGERPGRHSTARRPDGSRPWTVTVGRHAAERQALRQPVARGGRHSAPEGGAGPATTPLRGDGTPRWTTVAALLERALVHETPISALRPAPVRVVGSARVTSAGAVARPAAAPGAMVRPAPSAGAMVPPARATEDDAAERWAAEHWMPTQRRSEPGETVVRPVGWHPVPRPRHSTDPGPASPPAPGVAERLAG